MLFVPMLFLTLFGITVNFIPSDKPTRCIEYKRVLQHKPNRKTKRCVKWE